MTAEIRLKGKGCLNMFTTGLCMNMHINVNYSCSIPEKIRFMLLNWNETVKKNRVTIFRFKVLIFF